GGRVGAVTMMTTPTATVTAPAPTRIQGKMVCPAPRSGGGTSTTGAGPGPVAVSPVSKVTVSTRAFSPSFTSVFSTTGATPGISNLNVCGPGSTATDFPSSF